MLINNNKRKVNKKVNKNHKLLAALDDMTQKEGAYLRRARPGTPDILVFPAKIKIIDRHYHKR